jgi:hypothetical protein
MFALFPSVLVFCLCCSILSQSESDWVVIDVIDGIARFSSCPGVIEARLPCESKVARLIASVAAEAHRRFSKIRANPGHHWLRAPPRSRFRRTSLNAPSRQLFCPISYLPGQQSIKSTLAIPSWSCSCSCSAEPEITSPHRNQETRSKTCILRFPHKPPSPLIIEFVFPCKLIVY